MYPDFPLNTPIFDDLDRHSSIVFFDAEPSIKLQVTYNKP